MSVFSANLNVELETDGNVEINGQVNLTKPSENRGSYALDGGGDLHYQGSGHNLAMTLNGPPSGVSDAVVFLQQATTATVQIDSSASADLTGPVKVRGHLTVIISGAPPAGSAARTQTGSGESGSATWSGGNIDLGGGSSLQNSGTMTLNDPRDGSPAMTLENDAEFSNAGTVTWNGGTIRLEGNAQLVNEASGEFLGSGTIEGNVLNAGLFQVGSSIGSIIVTGQYTQLGTGELRMELAGTSSFDTLQVGTAAMESASLDGTLSVSLIDAFTPAAGNGFLIVDGPTEGSFSNCTPSEKTCSGLPELAPGLIWEVLHGSVSLNVVRTTKYFAQFGDGEVAAASGAQTLGTGTVQLSSELFLLNPDKTMEAGATILLKGDDGIPMSNIDLNGVTLPQGELDVTVPACGMRILRTDGQGPLQAGSATVTSDKELSGVVVFSSNVGAAGVGASEVLPTFVAPMFKNAEITTGIALQNPVNSQVVVDLELRDADGDLLATASITLPGMGHRALFVDEIDWTPEPGASFDFMDFEGLIKASTSAGGVAATVIQIRPQEFVTMPVSIATGAGNLDLFRSIRRWAAEWGLGVQRDHPG